MRPFAWHRAESVEDAVKAAAYGDVRFIAGGTTLLDLMKLDVMRADTLVDVSALAGQRYAGIEATADGVRLGPLARMADAAEHPLIRRDYPVIAQSLELAASPQLRNMASLAGNLLQRTRCGYFRDTSWKACNKRNPGSGCAALDGFNRMHAVLGISDACIATYAGDFAQALIALDASLDLIGPDGARKLPVAELHRLPGDTPDIETTLAPGELITAIVVPAAKWTHRSLYLKVRDRASYAFALASAAVALDMRGAVVREARIALGGIATVPWRSREAERVVEGRPLDEKTAAEAADAAFAGARTRKHNAYKLPLGKHTLVRALLSASRMDV
ncbi:MAG: FAD binding domain-containing protein [Gammaproteobacteria bacterium]